MRHQFRNKTSINYSGAQERRCQLVQLSVGDKDVMLNTIWRQPHDNELPGSLQFSRFDLQMKVPSIFINCKSLEIE